MSRYRIELRLAAVRALRKLDPQVAGRVQGAIVQRASRWEQQVPKCPDRDRPRSAEAIGRRPRHTLAPGAPGNGRCTRAAGPSGLMV